MVDGNGPFQYEDFRSRKTFDIQPRLTQYTAKLVCAKKIFIIKKPRHMNSASSAQDGACTYVIKREVTLQ